MERAADVLRQHHGDLLVSKQRLSQTDSIQLVRFKRENGGQETGLLCPTVRPLRSAGETAAR